MPFWTTQNVPPDRQLGYWREMLCEAYIALDSDSRRGSEFSGSVAAHLISDINVTRLRAEEHRVMRGPSEIRKTPLEYYFVNMQVRGDVLVSHCGREVHVRPDEFYVVDSTEPYDLHYRHDQEIFSFRVPKRQFDALVHRPADRMAVRVSRDTPMGAVAVDFLQSLLRQPQALPLAAGQSVAGMITELVALSLDSEAARAEHGALSGKPALLRTIMASADKTLMDPALSVRSMCERFGISPSYLHRLFATKDVSFGDWVRNRRLERCADELARVPGKSISGIALSWGFNDVSHFNHAFRKRFQMAPREYRQLHGPAPRAGFDGGHRRQAGDDHEAGPTR